MNLYQPLTIPHYTLILGPQATRLRLEKMSNSSLSQDNSLLASKSYSSLGPASYAHHLPSCPSYILFIKFHAPHGVEWGITLAPSGVDFLGYLAGNILKYTINLNSEWIAWLDYTEPRPR